ncbi:MAG: DUF4159 domain-containing protein [Myxococcales bacterium]|nr:DUF4159 domain-containing protein [Myxococcales bacterium]
MRAPRPATEAQSAWHAPAPRLRRRQLLLAAASLCACPRVAAAFGEEGAFNPRILLTGTDEWRGARTTAPARWSEELMRRTSAPARLSPTTVRADDPALLAEPFVVWASHKDPDPLSRREVRGLRQFIALGGLLLCDDFEPERGAFARGAKREITRVLPDASPIEIGPENVIFRSFYLLRRAIGRIEGAPKLEAIVRGGAVQVILTGHDLLGALARGAGGVETIDVVPGGARQRELAIRLAVNIAMYLLCSNYKDDQVHAPFLMRRRALGQP